MEANQMILDAVRRTAAVALGPLKLIVLGSHGRGDRDDAADRDLLVIEREIAGRAAEYVRPSCNRTNRRRRPPCCLADSMYDLRDIPLSNAIVSPEDWVTSTNALAGNCQHACR